MSQLDTAAASELRFRKPQAQTLAVDYSTAPKPDELIAEVIPGKRFAQFDKAWRELIPRSLVPNIFMSPGFVSAAANSQDILVALVWRRDGQDRRLEGVCALTRQNLRKFLPITISSATLNRHSFLSSPVVRRDNPDPVLHALFDAIAAEPKLAKTVRLRKATAETPMADLFSRVLAARQSRLGTVRERERPSINKKNFEGSFSVARGGKMRRELRRRRKRLLEDYDVTEVSYRGLADIDAVVENFLTLEASGWKGTKGTAIASSADDANFTRSWLTALAAEGDLRIEILRVDGTIIAMLVRAACGDRCFVWKFCYDEKYAAYGPGTLVWEQATKEILSDDDVKIADSCCWDNKGMQGRMWRDNLPVADIIFDVRRGGGILTSAMIFLDKCLVEGKKRLWSA